MSYALYASDHFLRQARKFFRKHPDLEVRFARIVTQLKEDPFHPALKLHALSGDMEGTHAISLTHSYRITLALKITEKETILLDIGDHEEVYR